jgi:hypothetical protein
MAYFTNFTNIQMGVANLSPYRRESKREEMLDKITIGQLDKWGACKRANGEEYSDENLRVLFGGKDYITPLEVLDLKIPIKDKVWVLLRKDTLGDQFMIPVNKAVDRAQKCAAFATINPITAAVACGMTRAVSLFTAYVVVSVSHNDDDDDDRSMYKYVRAASVCANSVHSTVINSAINSGYVNLTNSITNAAFVIELQNQIDDIKTILGKEDRNNA